MTETLADRMWGLLQEVRARWGVDMPMVLQDDYVRLEEEINATSGAGHDPSPTPIREPIKMEETILTPSTIAMSLADCPIGLFENAYGGLCLKTEYGNNDGRIDAYIVDSGEFFWGDAPQTIESQRAQLVYPVLRSPSPSKDNMT